MRKLWILILSAAILSACGCSDSNDSTSTGGDTGQAGIVQNLLHANVPVPGIAVGTPGGATDASDLDGKFTLAGVQPPYDIVASIPVASTAGIIYSFIVGGTAETAALGAVPAGFNSPSTAKRLLRAGLPQAKSGYTNDAASVEGTIGNYDAAGEDVHVSVGDGERANDYGTASLSTGDYSTSFDWLASPHHDVDVAALQKDSGGAYRYGRTSNVALNRNATSTVNVALSAVAGTVGSVAVSVSPPSGLTLGNVYWDCYVMIDGLPLLAEEITSASGNLDLPPIAGATYYVSVNAGLMDGVDQAGGYDGSWPGVMDGATINVSIPAPASVDAPADGAVNVSLTPEFTVTPSPGAQAAVFAMYGTDPYGDLNQTWYGIVDGGERRHRPPGMPRAVGRIVPARGLQYGIHQHPGWSGDHAGQHAVVGQHDQQSRQQRLDGDERDPAGDRGAPDQLHHGFAVTAGGPPPPPRDPPPRPSRPARNDPGRPHPPPLSPPPSPPRRPCS